MTTPRDGDPMLSLEKAAHSLGVEPAAVRLFVSLHMLRADTTDPVRVRQSDVRRLVRVMRRNASGSIPVSW